MGLLDRWWGGVRLMGMGSFKLFIVSYTCSPILFLTHISRPFIAFWAWATAFNCHEIIPLWLEFVTRTRGD